ncbi:hypothetical protein JTF06_06985 [Desemzia sp. RIT804]|uniref:hypothetical protein n=1 Tax=Desemzia sp. RIT 804 TaxID=2810209 RepID=UPI001951F622|nr:hypothetical protein [Desemzia sp. RIT 804]MBM6614632.1 hypothetical protein [Desemzia sp. RIT 804]
MKIIDIIKNNLSLILGLGILALIRPMMKITGIINLFSTEQFGSIFMTILISLVWLFIVVKKKAKNPIVVLVFAGITYSILAIILSGILSPILDGSLQGPLTNPLALVSVIVTNAIWGLVVGAVASAFLNRK